MILKELNAYSIYEFSLEKILPYAEAVGFLGNNSTGICAASVPVIRLLLIMNTYGNSNTTANSTMKK